MQMIIFKIFFFNLFLNNYGYCNPEISTECTKSKRFCHLEADFYRIRISPIASANPHGYCLENTSKFDQWKHSVASFRTTIESPLVCTSSGLRATAYQGRSELLCTTFFPSQVHQRTRPLLQDSLMKFELYSKETHYHGGSRCGGTSIWACARNRF